MKSQMMFSKQIPGLLIAGMLSLLVGCNNDKSESEEAAGNIPTTVSTDSNNVSGTTSASTDSNKMKQDGSMGDKSSATASTSRANPAKKGMKGKVSVLVPPKTTTGSMEADNTGVYTNVEVYPAYPGGGSSMQSFFDKNLVYPEAALNEGAEGTVNVMFTVDEKGKLTNPHVMGDKVGYGMDEEALRVVKMMPAWSPGKLKGKNVKTQYSLPVIFQLY